MSGIIKPPGAGHLSPPSRIVPPVSSASSMAAALGRPRAGKGGIYRKQESGPLVIIPDGTVIYESNVSYPFQFGVNCPSARIRVAFGIGAHPGAPASTATSFGTASFWNVVPCMRFPQTNDGVDASDYLFGRPLFDGSGYINNELTHISSVSPPTGGRALPDSYEAISMADHYRISGAIANGNTSNPMPPGGIYAWAAWEIIDPRDVEDSEALLALCTLELGQPAHLPQGA